MVKKWKYDGKLVTSEEKKIIDECDKKIYECRKKKDIIYERIHHLVVANNKFKKKQEIKDKEYRRIQEKLQEEAAKQEKLKTFLEKIKDFSKEYYTAIFDKEDIENIHETYKKICIHPEIFKTRKDVLCEIYIEGGGGGQGYDRSYDDIRPVWACNLCHTCDRYTLEYTACDVKFGDRLMKELNEKEWKPRKKIYY